MKKMKLIVMIASFIPIFAVVSGARAQEARAGGARGRGPGVPGVLVTMPVETKALKGAPYSAEIATDSTQTLADGNRIAQHSTGRVYRDAQGRVRREEDRLSGSPAISIVDPVAGVSYSLDPENRIAWKSPTPAGVEIMKNLEAMKVEVARRGEQEAAQAGSPGSEELQRRREDVQRKQEAEKMAAQIGGGRMGRGRGGAGEQRSDEQLPPRQMEGVRVEGHRTTTTIAAGAIGNDLPITIVSEEWVSPELQVLVMTLRKDPRNGESTYRLLNVVRRDPDPSLFQVPPEYTVKETGIRRFELPREER
jgi:hypothetical protein